MPSRRIARRAAAPAALALLLGLGAYVAARAGIATQQLYPVLVKDPERTPPSGKVVVAPADGIVLYVRRFTNGRAPLVVKNHRALEVTDLHKLEGGPREGLIVGIYMTTFGVHVNRAPLAGKLTRRAWFNGPDLDMSPLEKGLVLRALIPGPEALLDILGLSLSELVAESDHVLDSARESLVFEGDLRCVVVRIADYFVGEVLTWIDVGAHVETGERIGMITWGSQTDLIIETPDPSVIEVAVKEGELVRAGESIVARYR
ncbi:MAG: phosphatidylserine decarboxylase [Deltaproteobacteria bacterium]|nr:phosphatidylserine decarboxylase [Deltaproteobacteria bacterium]